MSDKRSHVLQVRLNDKELSTVEEMATDEGVTKSEALRRLVQLSDGLYEQRPVLDAKGEVIGWTTGARVRTSRGDVRGQGGTKREA